MEPQDRLILRNPGLDQFALLEVEVVVGDIEVHQVALLVREQRGEALRALELDLLAHLVEREVEHLQVSVFHEALGDLGLKVIDYN